MNDISTKKDEHAPQEDTVHSRVDKSNFLAELLAPNDDEKDLSSQPSEPSTDKASDTDVKKKEPPAAHHTAAATKKNSVSSKKHNESRKKISKIRKIIADKLVETQQQAAMLTTFSEVDMTQIIALKNGFNDAFKKKHDVNLGFISFFVKAATLALKESPIINSFIDGDEIVTRDYYDIAVSIGTNSGIVAPVIRDCDTLSFAEIEQKIIGYAVKADNETIGIDDLSGGSFTITNGGIYGSLMSMPILNPPQCAILAMHAIQKRPIVDSTGAIVAHDMMFLALTYDNRIVDGREAVSFLTHIKNIIENPASLALEL